MPKGQKQCKCGATMGPRTKVCPKCEAVLIQPNQIVDEDGNAIIVPKTRTIFSYPEGYNIPDTPMIRISVPAGECPVKLTDLDEENIIEWAIKIREKQIPIGHFMTNNAIMVWARQQLAKLSSTKADLDRVRSLIMNLPDVTYKTVEVN